MISSADRALGQRIEAAFGAAAPTIRRFAIMAAALMAFAFVANTAKIVMEVNAPGFDGEAVKIDFTAFWAAARLALAGNPASAFDPNVFREAMAVGSGAPEGDLLWLYPPAWHIVITPLGLMPFSAAYIVYSMVALAAFAAAMRPLAVPLPGGLALVLGAPAVIIILTLGNNSLLWTAGLAGALAALAQGRAMLAGCLIAALTLKPQLGLMIPFALAFGGHWRTVLWACLGTAALLAVSTAVMGVDYWRSFFAMMGFMSGLMQTDIVRFDRMMTWYALLRLGGLSSDIAMPVQIAFTVAAAAVISWVWSRRDAGPEIKAAALCVAIPLTTPYAYHYEMTLTLAAALFLVRDGFGASPLERFWLLALWLGPVPGLALLNTVPPVIYAAPLLTATLVLCVARAARPDRPPVRGVAA